MLTMTERKVCLMCKNTEFETFFKNDYTSGLSFSFSEKDEDENWIPFNILACSSCHTVQTKYIADLSILYNNNHVDSFGSTKSELIDSFSKFISKNKSIDGIIEVGTPAPDLANRILKEYSTDYTIIEPSFIGKKGNITIVDSFIENVNFSSIKGNTLIMSQVFEHFYDPPSILEKVSNTKLEYLYLCHPQFTYFCKNDVYNILNVEHVSYYEEEFLYELMKKYGFYIEEQELFKQHAIYLKFIRKPRDTTIQLKNISAIEDTRYYFNTMIRRIEKLNTIMKENKDLKFYLWPASAHTIATLTMGIDTTRVSGLLDNSPNKIGKKLIGYKIPCFSFEEMLRNTDPMIRIVIGCSGSYINELSVAGSDKIIYLKNL